MPQSSDRNLVLHGIIWKYVDRTAVQAVQFLVSLILARLLAPEEFGTLTLVTVFLNIALVFVQHGVGSALVQKQNIGAGELVSVYYFSFILGTVLALIIVIIAPFLCRFLGYPSIVRIVRVLALTLPLAGVSNVLESVLMRNLEFKKIFTANICGGLISAMASIWTALNGYGIWALVIQQVSFQLVSTLVLHRLVRLRRTAAVSFRSIYPLISYGWKLLLSSLIDTVYANLRTLLIGKYFRPETVGYYDKGRQFPAYVISNVNATIQSVMFPALSKKQSDVKVLKAMVRKSIGVSTFLIWPCMTGLMVVSKVLIRLLLTDKWLPAVPYMLCFCMIYSFWPISTTNLQVIKAVGRSDIFLKLEILKKALGIGIMVFTLPFGIRAMMIGSCINAAIALFLNAMPNRKLIGYTIPELFADMIPAGTLSAVMGAAAFAAGFIPAGDLQRLFCQVLAGVAVYAGMAAFFRVPGFVYLTDLIGQYRRKKKTERGD